MTGNLMVMKNSSALPVLFSFQLSLAVLAGKLPAANFITAEINSSIDIEALVPDYNAGSSGSYDPVNRKIFGMKPVRFVFVALTILFHLYVIPRTVIRTYRYLKKRRMERKKQNDHNIQYRRTRKYFINTPFLSAQRFRGIIGRII